MFSFLITMLFLGSANAIDVHGHRGARALFPENTIPAFEHAIEVGADYIELDVVVTVDRKLVVNHDLTVNQDLCLNPNGDRVTETLPIFEMTLERLKTFDCGSLKNPNFPDQVPIPGTKVPTLDDVFELVRTRSEELGRDIRMNIEMKNKREKPEWSPTHEEFAQLMADSINKSALQPVILVQTFDENHLIYLKKHQLDIKTAFLIKKGSKEETREIAEKVGADVISPNYRFLSQSKIKYWQDAGFQVVPWTVNSPKTWKSLIKKGVNGIITDNPKGLIEYLGR